MNKHPLDSISFLQPINELKKEEFKTLMINADKNYQEKNTNKNQEIDTEKEKNDITPQKSDVVISSSKQKPSKKTLSLIPIQEKEVFDPSTNNEEITLKTIEENAEKFKASFNEITNDFKEQIKDLSLELQESKKSLEILSKLTEQDRSSFFSNIFKKKKNESTSFIKKDKHTIPVTKESITSPYQIVNSKTLLHYASDWTRTIFSNRVLFKAIPGSGTILLILPKGNIHFIQFNYKTTPIHPTQEDFKTHLSPIKVLEFNHFIDYRNWLYEELRHI